MAFFLEQYTPTLSVTTTYGVVRYVTSFGLVIGAVLTLYFGYQLPAAVICYVVIAFIARALPEMLLEREMVLAKHAGRPWDAQKEWREHWPAALGDRLLKAAVPAVLLIAPLFRFVWY